MSTCDDNYETPKNGSSCSGVSGAGCCQAGIPKGIQYYNGYFNENYNTTDPKWRSSPCGYMAVMETAAFRFSTTYLNSKVFNDTYKGQAPVVMDWVITRETCKDAKRNTSSYACVSSNSYCVDINGQGYRCNCSSGYEGNPYIEDGCTGPVLLLLMPPISAMRWNMHKYTGEFHLYMPARKTNDEWRLHARSEVHLGDACRW